MSDTLALLLGARRLAAAEHAGPQFERLRHAFAAYVDDGVADRILTEGVVLEPTLVEATVLFLDIRHFTDFSESHTPQEVLTLLNDLWGLLVLIVRLHGWHPNKFLGDGLLRVGIEIHTGSLTAGTVGGGGRLEFTVLGNAVNTAARIESATKQTGTAILLSAVTASALREPRNLTEHPSIELKGKSEPLVLYSVPTPAHAFHTGEPNFHDAN